MSKNYNWMEDWDEITEKIVPIEPLALSQKMPQFEMAFDRKVARRKLEEQSRNIISLWCLLRYFAIHDPTNGLINHERGKLCGLLKSLKDIAVKKTDSPRVKRQMLHGYWCEDGFDYDKYPIKVVNVFEPKFKDEQIQLAPEDALELANAFIAEMNTLLYMICDATYEEISAYIEKL